MLCFKCGGKAKLIKVSQRKKFIWRRYQCCERFSTTSTTIIKDDKKITTEQMI